MPHPVDAVVQQYHAKLDELQNLDRQIQQIASLQKKRADAEAELVKLRTSMAAKAVLPEVTDAP